LISPFSSQKAANLFSSLRVKDQVLNPYASHCMLYTNFRSKTSPFTLISEFEASISGDV